MLRSCLSQLRDVSNPSLVFPRQYYHDDARSWVSFPFFSALHLARSSDLRILSSSRNLGFLTYVPSLLVERLYSKCCDLVHAAARCRLSLAPALTLRMLRIGVTHLFSLRILSTPHASITLASFYHTHNKRAGSIR